MKLLAATGNRHKLEEFKRILEPLGVEVLSPADVGVELDVEETGATFIDNAALKAQALQQLTGLAAFADDSGLCVDALDDRPGVYSARYGGEGLTYVQRVALLLEEMKEVPPEKRGGRFVSAIYCVLADGTVVSCQEECRGMIAHAPTGGENGFAYDPIFIWEDGRSFSQISDAEKDAVSHRGKALRTFNKLLAVQLGDAATV